MKLTINRITMAEYDVIESGNNEYVYIDSDSHAKLDAVIMYIIESLSIKNCH